MTDTETQRRSKRKASEYLCVYVLSVYLNSIGAVEVHTSDCVNFWFILSTCSLCFAFLFSLVSCLYILSATDFVSRELVCVNWLSNSTCSMVCSAFSSEALVINFAILEAVRFITIVLENLSIVSIRFSMMCVYA